MKILIIGGYSCGNPGDEAILKTTIYHLKSLYPTASFRIWSGIPDFKIKFDRQITHEVVYWQPFKWVNNHNLLSQVMSKIYTDCFPISKWIAMNLQQLDRKTLESMKDFDMAIFVGGGYINSYFSLMEMNFISTLAKELGKPIYLLGQTLGPFHKTAHVRMAKEIFHSADRIVLRDMESSHEVTEFKGKVAYGVDDALAFRPEVSDEDKEKIDDYLSKENQETFYLGMNLRKWTDTQQHYAQIAQAIGEFSRAVSGKLKVVFIPMETSRFCDDRLEGKELAKHLPPGIDYVQITEEITVEQKHYLISRMDMLVGMRFHALVFALASAVPAIGLYKGMYYFRKISGLFNPFGMEKTMLSFERIEELATMMRQLVLNQESIKEMLVKNGYKVVQNQEWLLKNIMRRKENPMKISVIIPTLNRPADLKMALESLMEQTYLPNEIIVVDQSPNDRSKNVMMDVALAHAEKKVEFRHLAQTAKSLVKARNRGLEAAAGDMVSFLDDDVVLFPDYYEKIVHYFEKNPTTGALSGSMIVRRPSGLKWEIRKAVMRLFLLSDFSGSMTVSGFGYPICEREIERPISVELLPGCNMNFRQEAVQDERFDEWFTGYSFREDVDYVYRISKKTRVAMIPDAKLYHHHSAANRMDMGTLKKMETRNYYYCFNKFKETGLISRLLFAYSFFGLLLIDLFEFLASLQTVKLHKFLASAGAASSFLWKGRHEFNSETEPTVEPNPNVIDIGPTSRSRFSARPVEKTLSLRRSNNIEVPR